MTEPLDFPADAAGWTAFATERPAERMTLVHAVDARLKSESGLSTVERLELWNDADIALREALAEAYVVSEAHPDATVRALAEEQVQAIETLSASRLLDRDLWRAFADASADSLDPEESRLLTHLLRDFRRGGVELEDAERERVQQLTERDTELSLAFSRNIRDGRREVKVPLAALAGLPQDFIDARPADEDGLVALSTDYPDLMPVREYATDRATRIALVGAYNELAWPDNEPILAELLEVRAERARLLGYADWADYETETRMIGGGAQIAEFLTRLDEASAPAAEAEYPLLLERLRQDAPDASAVTIADFWHVLSTMKRERHDVDAQLVRSYFPFENVLDGILDVTGRLLDVEYVPVESPAWHEDVRTYDVRRDGERIGRIHLDLHPREGKFSHAACFPIAPASPAACCRRPRCCATSRVGCSSTTRS